MTDEPQVCPVSISGPAVPPCAIAHAKYAVPVAWALLFDPEDLTEAEHIGDDGEVLQSWAPVSRTARALDVLASNAAKLAPLLGPNLADYTRLLSEELRSRGAAYVSVDAFDLVAMAEEDSVRPALTALYSELATLSDASAPARPRGLRSLFSRRPRVLQHLCDLSGLRPRAGLLDAECLIHNRGLTEAGLENHWAMLGSQYGGPVAWDPGPAITGTAREVIAARSR